MDKFDEFLKKKTEDENNEFTLPESFNLKIEETLKCLEDNKKEKWYKNRKIISMVACFALVFFVGLRYTVFNGSLTINESTTMDMQSDSVQRSSIPEPEISNYSLENSEDFIINQNEVKELTIKSLSGEAKFKFVNKEEDINNIIESINKLYKFEVIDQGISEWDFLIQTTGEVNHTIEVKGNLINIDNRCYESNEDISEIIRNIYDNLNYEEKNIKY
ncbi:hypothetical protein [Clostridium disporicum]|jgi:hypothetical protein|uniref:DUF4367 domain-containing protein n=2 Tax=Clostridiaceae TaxID=31979 RepID=A0A174EKG4_9CLOT|nr:hypothetical protein [Clostridium disporicum]CUO37757.1 Uncharacterised protein [Clostridium disporicum]